MNLEQRQKFFSALARLVKPDDAGEAEKAMAPILAMLSDVPDFAFQSRECLARVASAKRRTIVPAYADIRSAMLGWVQDQPRPVLPGLDAERGLEGEDLLWLRYFRRREQEGFGPVKQGARSSTREHVLSLVKQQSLAAWERITGETEVRKGEPTAEEIDLVRAAVQRAKAAMRATAEPWTPTAAQQRRVLDGEVLP